ncbi:peptide-methionine (S)-S-oxide reductase [Methanolobus sp.]|uniref:peptide-methionine (S)-S-oxide reductase MsrA n=1 Tax=Methanolobus sp. TaxID=1874737 RepID=UPI0025E6E076|nr:peptide-methionine (S)-S-oxide reductase [Methanolobus sp.]
MEKTTFAAGCFWGVEIAFREIDGVLSTRVGYTGGVKENPGYTEVLSGKTGHAEAVEVTFDPALVTYRELLTSFWSIHDPTLTRRELITHLWSINDPSTLDTIPDYAGSQYRSSIFYHDEDQRLQAAVSMKEMENSLGPGKRILTEIVPATVFYQAESKHQQYIENSPGEDREKLCSVRNCTIK